MGHLVAPVAESASVHQYLFHPFFLAALLTSFAIHWDDETISCRWNENRSDVCHPLDDAVKSRSGLSTVFLLFLPLVDCREV